MMEGNEGTFLRQKHLKERNNGSTHVNMTSVRRKSQYWSRGTVLRLRWFMKKSHVDIGFLEGILNRKMEGKLFMNQKPLQ